MKTMTKLCSATVAGLLAVWAAVPMANASAPITPAWLNTGPDYQYPSTGGTQEYGFWYAKVRSYYTVGRNHGSTVDLNGSKVVSVCTATGQKSIAEKSAVNYWNNNDAYYYRVC